MASGACGDRTGALPIGKAHIRYHRKGLESVLETDLGSLLLQTLLVAMADEGREVLSGAYSLGFGDD